MKTHIFVAVLLVIALGLSALAVGQTQMDIALEGPWILFTDTMNGNGVLVAVAPMDATDTEPIDEDYHFHHYPQLSSGNGYYLPSHGIFCLAFDKQCAPPPPAGAGFSTGAGYPAVKLLQLTGNIANKQWLSYGVHNDVVILPLPDFYHTDGFWPIRFLDQSQKVSVGPDTYSIGIVLHYSTATSRLRLYSCTPITPNAISTTDCPNEAHDDYPHLIEVTNTGTLRLQMRAPDTTDDCDHHVRYAFHQMLKLIDPTYMLGKNSLYRYIDLAQAMNNTMDIGVFDTDNCWAEDVDANDQEEDSSGSDHADVTKQQNSMSQANPFSGTLTAINEKWGSIAKSHSYLDDNHTFETARGYFNQAFKLRGSLLITDVRKMGALAELSANQIGILIAELHAQRNNEHAIKDESDTIQQFETLTARLKAFADGTKNGADCRAAQVQVK